MTLVHVPTGYLLIYSDFLINCYIFLYFIQSIFYMLLPLKHIEFLVIKCAARVESGLGSPFFSVNNVQSCERITRWIQQENYTQKILNFCYIALM